MIKITTNGYNYVRAANVAEAATFVAQTGDSRLSFDLMVENSAITAEINALLGKKDFVAAAKAAPSVEDAAFRRELASVVVTDADKAMMAEAAAKNAAMYRAEEARLATLAAKNAAHAAGRKQRIAAENAAHDRRQAVEANRKAALHAAAAEYRAEKAAEEAAEVAKWAAEEAAKKERADAENQRIAEARAKKAAEDAAKKAADEAAELEKSGSQWLPSNAYFGECYPQGKSYGAQVLKLMKEVQ